MPGSAHVRLENVVKRFGRVVAVAGVSLDISRRSLTTILGLLPVALGLGEGAEANAPLAIAVIGGLAVSTLLTLVFIPVLYALFEERRSRTPA